MTAIGEQRSAKGIFLGRVLANRPVCSEHGRIVLEVSQFPDASPGQFVQILCADPDNGTSANGAFIRRPFSIAGLRRDGDQCEIDILYRVVGVGSRWLASRNLGDSVSLLGPLGQPFRLMADRTIAYLVGGGVGLPPLIWLAQLLCEADKQAVAFCGSRTADLLPLTREAAIPIHGDQATLAWREFARFDTPAVVGTDDGSLGASGQIPEIFERYLDQHADTARFAVAYTCGPEPMMQEVSHLCRERSIPCQVSLERMMACGMATCQSCVVRIRDETDEEGWRYRLCCQDGPVFDANQVIWDTEDGIR